MCSSRLTLQEPDWRLFFFQKKKRGVGIYTPSITYLIVERPYTTVNRSYYAHNRIIKHTRATRAAKRNPKEFVVLQRPALLFPFIEHLRGVIVVSHFEIEICRDFDQSCKKEKEKMCQDTPSFIAVILSRFS